MAVVFGENALSSQTIDELFKYIQKCEAQYVWSSNFMWGKALTVSIGAILTHALSKEWTHAVVSELHSRGKLGHIPQTYQEAVFYSAHACSHIAWHTDYVDKNSMTIYLSRDWDPNFGGYFCWKEWEDGAPRDGWGSPPPSEAKMRYPSYNSYVYMTEAEWHTTTITAPCAPPRLSLQLFFGKE